MSKNTYTVTYDPLWWSCIVSIEDEHNGKPTLETIKQMVEFWTGWEDLLEENDGDYIMAFLRQLAIQAFRICVANNYNTYGVVQEFNDMEGYCKMDGSLGIAILSIDHYESDPNDFSIEKSTTENTLNTTERQ